MKKSTNKTTAFSNTQRTVTNSKPAPEKASIQKTAEVKPKKKLPGKRKPPVVILH